MKTKDIIKHFEGSGTVGRTPNRTGNKNVDRVATALWVGREAKDWIEKGKSKYREATTWTVTVEESDSSYLAVQQWLLKSLPKTKQKNVTAATKTVYIDADGSENTERAFDDMFSEGNGKISETRVVLSLAETRVQEIDIAGHKVHVRITNQPDPDAVGGAGGMPGRRPMRTAGVRNGRIIFQTRSVEAQNAVVTHLNSMVGGRNKRKPTLWIADGWGQWRQQDAPARKITSVILRDGLKDDIRGDIQKFLDDEKKYTDLGIPWHRGYLFHGPPGTGKTSLIKALAADMGLDLWYAPLGDLKEDSSLVDLIRSVRPRGILLLEDVDAYQAAKDRDNADNKETDAGAGISSTALLNALDGVVTPHGLITIMTTNHIEKLDPALIRSGRADQTIELGLPSISEIALLWELFFPNEHAWLDASLEVPGMSQADVSEIFKSNWDEPDRARKELVEKLDALRETTDA